MGHFFSPDIPILSESISLSLTHLWMTPNVAFFVIMAAAAAGKQRFAAVRCYTCYVNYDDDRTTTPLGYRPLWNVLAQGTGPAACRCRRPERRAQTL